MRVGVVGLNYLTAPFSIRERMTALCEALIFPCPAVILTTCNRCEIYFAGDFLEKIRAHLLHVFLIEVGESIEPFSYTFYERECFAHLARVTSGLDSAVVGETEIQAQVKRVYEAARVSKKLPSDLHALFQKSLKIGKKMRNDDSFPKSGRGFEQAIAELLGERSKKILFVGNSMINRKIIDFFQRQKKHEVALVTHGTTSGIKKERIERWTKYDGVVAATKSDRYLIDKYEGNKKVDLFDLSMPRNIDPKIGEHEAISLYNIDDLTHRVKQKIAYAPLEEVIERNFNSWLSRGRGEMQRCPVCSPSR